jgi:transcription-repair coupling factor (superfamily II helicase)
MGGCPSREELQRLLTRQVSAAEGAALERHVEQCAPCQEALEELTRTGDVESWRRLRGEGLAGDASDRDFLQQLKETPPSAGPSTRERRLEQGPAPVSTERPRVAGYELLEILGRGGMGVVYKARQVGLNRVVALKMILAGPHADERERARFRAEADVVARLQHPHIVQVFDVGEQDGRPWLALEFIDGGTLAKRLGGAPLPARTAAQLTETLARAVSYAHGHGIVHRDLKPGNILLVSPHPPGPPLPQGGEGGARPSSSPPPPVGEGPGVGGLTGHLCDYLAGDAWTAMVEPDELHEQGKLYLERAADPRGLFSVPGVFQQLVRFPSIRITALPSPSVEATCHLRVESVEHFSGDVSRVRDELDGIAEGTGQRVLIACHNEAECKRLGDVLAAGKLAQSDLLRLDTGRVHRGFRMVDVGVVVLGGQELFHREEVRQIQPRRRLESRAIDSFLDLNEHDLVVHVSHGIARYHGMQMLEKNGQTEEHLILEFRDGVRLYVPASRIDLVQKYVGGSNTDPELSKLGGTGWQRRKEKVQEAVLDLASDMLQIQALREAKPGIALPSDTEWQAEFEASFPYQETPDQLTTLVEIKRDMERPRPMDRLICGDVGYGKTELAIRAAFKAIDNGRQVAVLVPTTVLAEQHFRTFSQRLAEYPFVVEGISRFRSAREQKRILERLAQGGVDVIIGTHRLVSADVQFKDLGLVIIDEEQRFGVEHKERLKRLRQTVDVLTMTATPIPRTLHLALLGIRDISNLETPPADRLAIETRIALFDPTLIRHAILRELNRDGQIYFVHNRVYNIQAVAEQVRKIVPEARVTVAHGQMAEGELEQAMLSFVRREVDILVATTIIESGLDIPNANTIFINQADNYGLADLHQLRGRVGRYKHRAYAYLLLDSERSVTPNAARRLKAIEEFTELGAGFKIALRDLEIRGAGNILGTQQSGHIAAVGYEMYCQLLENAVRGLRNQRLRTPLEVHLDLPWDAYLPRDYVTGQRLRIEVYRRLARVRKLDRLEDFRQELRDRFGPIPEAAEWLLRLAELRLLAARWQIATLHLEKPPAGSVGPTDVVLGYKSSRQIQRLAKRSGGRLRVVDEASAYFRLRAAEEEPAELYTALRQLLHVEQVQPQEVEVAEAVED